MAKDLTKQKYADIRRDYQKWAERRYKGVQIYSDSYIFVKLSERYYLRPTTIENIVFSRITPN